MKLYHFMKEEYALKAISHKRLKIALLDQLNDPFEFVSIQSTDDQVKQVFELTKVDLSQKCGILCFSRDFKNPLLWSHYSDNHKGVCLVFETDKKIGDDFLEVDYKNEFIDIPVDFLGEHNQENDEKIVLKYLATKYDNWKYEDELRFFYHLIIQQKKAACISIISKKI